MTYNIVKYLQASSVWCRCRYLCPLKFFHDLIASSTF